MLRTMYKAIKTFVFVIILGAVIYLYRAPLLNLWNRFTVTYFPCAQPIGYTLGSFDTRFGLSKDQFLAAINKAEQIWEKPLGKELFVYQPDGNLEINLVYDYRQEATTKLRELGLTISDDKASYETLKAKYKAMEAEYAQKKILFESQLAAFENHKKSYEEKVAYWNERGGVTPKVYAQLEKERMALEAELARLNKTQDELNALIDNINAMITVLNRLAESLNVDAGLYNQTSDDRGEEFEEGFYQNGPNGPEITIYQFDSNAKLIRVLTHELGHALGLEHLADPKAIMYRLHQGTNEKLTENDLAALKTLCRIKY